jgi:vancomycin permeability regulator SanA
MLLANAFYNITHYGNARYFYEGKVVGEGQYSPFTIDSVFTGFLTDMKLASKYYNQALQAAKTDEQKAKCHYMLAKCERNQWYNETVYSDKENEYRNENPKGDFKAWAGFKTLKQYSTTQYYKDVIKECGYFRTYINK